jgi:hypothetical protein
VPVLAAQQRRLAGLGGGGGDAGGHVAADEGDAAAGGLVGAAAVHRAEVVHRHHARLHQVRPHQRRVELGRGLLREGERVAILRAAFEHAPVRAGGELHAAVLDRRRRQAEPHREQGVGVVGLHRGVDVPADAAAQAGLLV